MPIQPIAQNRSQDLGLLQLLNNGSQSITGILDKAVQLGRDRSNNQFRVGEQGVQSLQLAQGMAQRRAQDLDASILNRQKIAYGKEQDQKRYDLLNQQREDRLVQQGVVNEQGRFNNDISAGKYAMAQEEFGMKVDAVKSDRAARQAQIDYYRGDPTEPIQGGNPFVDPSATGGDPFVDPSQQPRGFMDVEKSSGNQLTNNMGEGVQKAVPVSEQDEVLNQPPAPQSDIAALYQQNEVAKNRAMQARTTDDPLAIDNTAREAGRAAALLADAKIKHAAKVKAEAKATAPPTEEQLRARNEDVVKADARKVAGLKTLVKENSQIFGKKFAMLGEKATDDEKASARLSDAEQFSSEVNFAKEMKRDEYMAKQRKVTKRGNELRGQLWDYAHGVNTVANPAPTPQPNGEPDAEADAIERLRKRKAAQ
jgi:hypothetical protein